jgi:HEAT repeat protein
MTTSHCITTGVVWLILLDAVAVAQEESRKIGTVEEAIKVVDNPASGFANMSRSELQVHYRLRALQWLHEYQFQEEHAAAWKAYMLDPKRSPYGRLCAAYYLLDKDIDARAMVQRAVASKNLRHRYNAAEMVAFHLGSAKGAEWDTDLLLNLLTDGALDGSGITSTPGGKFPEGDVNDIMHAPLDFICRTLGRQKDKRAVPALIAALEKHPGSTGAAMALAEIGDVRGAPALLKVLKDKTGNQGFEIEALADLKYKEAVPVLIERLFDPPKAGQFGDFETEKILKALLKLGDERAIEPLEKYLQGQHDERSVATARRVLVQLKSKDPVPELIKLLDAETYEPEKADLIRDLSNHGGDVAWEKCNSLAGSSDSAFLRREAIFGLARMKSRKSLLTFAALLEADYPPTLNAEWGWTGAPDFREFFPDLLEKMLKATTKQDFGRDRKKWEAWIMQNVKE